MTYLGLRPGEKLYEELLVKTEELDKTENSMIFIERDTALSAEKIDEKLEILKAACATGDDDQANKISRSKIYELIADNMNVAADTVRKYRSEQDGIAEKQAQNLLNACIRFEVENHLRRTKLSKFVDEYKETVEKLIGEPLDIRDPELPYIADYFHIMKREDEKQWNSTVCPPELEKCPKGIQSYRPWYLEKKNGRIPEKY